MINTNDNHVIIKNCSGEKKPWNSQNPEISMVRFIYLFILR